MDEEQRNIYNRFGYDSISFDPRKDEMKLVSDIGVLYVLWIVLSYIMTIPIEAHTSRTWLAILGIVMLAIDISFLLTDTDIPTWCPTTLTEYEVHLYMHSIYPLLIVLCRCLSSYLYIDTDATSMAVLAQISSHQKVDRYCVFNYIDGIITTCLLI